MGNRANWLSVSSSSCGDTQSDADQGRRQVAGRQSSGRNTCCKCREGVTEAAASVVLDRIKGPTKCRSTLSQTAQQFFILTLPFSISQFLYRGEPLGKAGRVSRVALPQGLAHGSARCPAKCDSHNYSMPSVAKWVYCKSIEQREAASRRLTKLDAYRREHFAERLQESCAR